MSKIRWAKSRKDLTLLHANTKGADKPAHPRSLISTIVILSLESISSLTRHKSGVVPEGGGGAGGPDTP